LNFYQSVALEKLYIFGFGSVKIGRSFRPPIHENCGSAPFRRCGRTLHPIELDPKDFKYSRELFVEQFILAPIKFEKNYFKKRKVAAATELKMRRLCV